jgi:thiol:disulfide interchange protein
VSRRAPRLVAALGVALAAVVAAYVLAPRLYNARRLRSFHGRRVYDEKADTGVLYQAALAQARAQHRRVLVVLGGNWCQWCLALDDLMSKDEEIHRYLSEHFVLVKLDNAAAEALDEAWGTPTKEGVPVLVFLDADGKVAHVQESISLEAFGGRILAHDRDRVLQVLQQWG